AQELVQPLAFLGPGLLLQRLAEHLPLAGAVAAGFGRGAGEAGPVLGYVVGERARGTDVNRGFCGRGPGLAPRARPGPPRGGRGLAGPELAGVFVRATAADADPDSGPEDPTFASATATALVPDPAMKPELASGYRCISTAARSTICSTPLRSLLPLLPPVGVP